LIITGNNNGEEVQRKWRPKKIEESTRQAKDDKTQEEIFEERLAAAEKKAYEEASQKGYSEGFNKGNKAGLEQGYSDGYEKGKITVEQKKKELSAIVENLNEPLNLVTESVLESSVELAKNIAFRIMEKEIEMSPDFIVEQISNVLSTLSRDTVLEIKLNTDDHQTILELNNKDFKHVKFLSQKGLPRGEVIVNTESGTKYIDWRKAVEALEI
jgi:flagellar biosynthesis/type III secretory pathway protein FliH